MYTYLAIERTPGFLKTEIVVQILVREVAAFKRDIIAAILQTIAQCQVMGELVGYHEILVLATDGLRIVGEAVHVLVVVSHGQYIPFLPEVAPIEVYVKISKLIGHIGNACLVTEISTELPVLPICIFSLSRTFICVKLPPTLSQRPKP